MTKIYQQAFTEAYEILNYLDETDYKKIPTKVVNAIKDNRDTGYDFFIDESLPFYEQDILEETKAILFNLYRDYLANQEIKNKIIKFQQNKVNETERLKKEKYEYKDLFKKH